MSLEIKENCKTRVKYNMECKNAINQEDKCKSCKKIDDVFGPAPVEKEKRYKTYTDPKLESEDNVEEEKR